MKDKFKEFADLVFDSLKLSSFHYTYNGVTFRFIFSPTKKNQLTSLMNELELTYNFPNNDECEINLKKRRLNNFHLYASEEDFMNGYDEAVLNYNLLILTYKDSYLLKLENEEINQSNSLIFNFDCYRKILQFILDSKDFYSLKSDTDNLFILFSDKGPFEIGYNLLESRVGTLEDLRPAYAKLKSDFEKLEFKRFFKDAVIQGVNQYTTYDRFYHIVESLMVLLNIADRDYQIYLKQFSFEKIKNEFKEKREKYFENIEKGIETVSKQVTSFPLTFAVSIFAGYQVKDKPSILILVFLGYFLYTFIANKVLSISSFNIENIKKDVQFESQRIINFYGSLNELFKEDFEKINTKIGKLENLILYLKIILWGLLILFLVFSCYEMYFQNTTSLPIKVQVVK